MTYSIAAPLLDALVLAVVCREETYGYRITQDVREAIDISESTLYPVLRRLQKDGCLETYDRETGGRNRRYYRATRKGSLQLKVYIEDWRTYKEKIEQILLGGDTHD
ncbi:hypothetical protein SDC9_95077 [bioreactor metagenome]|uniref:Transcription regulator PadR N-terminal domain-containing protein n=1 Tax=bioreactor metagenome TaxID=1076179 RepID=A0A645ABW2_9ZZZZ